VSSVTRFDGVELQRELRDLLCLAVVGDHLRWVTVNDDGELRRSLDHAIPRWRALADDVANQLVALGIPPDGRVRSLAEDIPLNWVPDGWLEAEEARALLAQRLHVLAGWASYRGSQCSDPDSTRVLGQVQQGLAGLT
jgi:starvation-inducible DNA-binding protein